jgi:hypothetical protein
MPAGEHMFRFIKFCYEAWEEIDNTSSYAFLHARKASGKLCEMARNNTKQDKMNRPCRQE